MSKPSGGRNPGLCCQWLRGCRLFQSGSWLECRALAYVRTSASVLPMRPWENEHPSCLLSDSEYLSLSSLISQETTLCSSSLLCLVGLGLHQYLKLQLQNFSAGQGAYLEYAKLALTLSRICQTSPKMLHICAPSWYVEIKSLLQLGCGHGFTLDECSLLSVKPEKHSLLRACATQSPTSAERREARKAKIKKRRKKNKEFLNF